MGPEVYLLRLALAVACLQPLRAAARGSLPSGRQCDELALGQLTLVIYDGDFAVLDATEEINVSA